MGFMKNDKGELWAYGAIDTFHMGLAICSICGAAVPNLKRLMDAHGEWHERLKLAADEAKTLR